MGYGRRHILSKPIKIRWAGWESNTLSLQNAGWEISAQEMIGSYKLRIAIRNTKLRAQGISDEINFDYFEYRDFPYMDVGIMSMDLSQNIVVTRPISADIFEAVDARPMYTDNKLTLDDFAYFKKVNHNVQDIFLKEASMQDILQLALERQEPKQTEIRDKLLKEKEYKDFRRDSNVKAELRLVI